MIEHDWMAQTEEESPWIEIYKKKTRTMIRYATCILINITWPILVQA